MPTYTGIGSRNAPPVVLDAMEDLAVTLRELGYHLRSGGAKGSDQAFGRGAGQDATIYLPWPGYGVVEDGAQEFFPGDFPERIKLLAESAHAAWSRVHPRYRPFHYRNVYQVLGHREEPEPSQFIVCWTPMGKVVGGTATALRLAYRFKIPVFNLAVMPMTRVPDLI
jgi:hypothetical protein